MMRLWVLLLACVLTVDVTAARIKDITNVAGIRDNQLVGYGLVVGLDGTGDKTNQAPFTDQSFRSMLASFGVQLPKGRSMQLRNVAAVAVSATLPPFGRIGQRIDVTVSSLGNATSLRGGTLLLLPLKGVDNEVYALAQGNVVVSGFGINGADGSKVSVNSTSSGRIPSGAIIEQAINTPYVRNGVVTLELSNPDFTTSQRIADVINHHLGHKAAEPLDAGAVAVRVHPAALDSSKVKSSYVGFIARIENLAIHPGDVAAKVVVNSRSGTIVVGQEVTLSPVAVTHGNLSVAVKETNRVSQPEGFSQGKTTTVTDSSLAIAEQKGRAFVLEPMASLRELVDAINRVGAAPGDLIAILEAIKQAGALHAELEVI